VIYVQWGRYIDDEKWSVISYSGLSCDENISSFVENSDFALGNSKCELVLTLLDDK